MKTPEVGETFINTWQTCMDEVIEPYDTTDLSESQSSKGNIEGRLNTIEEKPFGNLKKTRRNTQYIDVLTPAEQPSKGPGLYFADTSSATAECVTLLAAWGVQSICFRPVKAISLGIRSNRSSSSREILAPYAP